MDTLATFSVGVEKVGDIKCLHPQVKLMMMELLDEQLEEAIEALEAVVSSEDRDLEAGTTLRRDYGNEAFQWTGVVNNIMDLGKMVYYIPSCTEGALPADLVKKWQQRFDIPPEDYPDQSSRLLPEGWDEELVWI